MFRAKKRQTNPNAQVGLSTTFSKPLLHVLSNHQTIDDVLDPIQLAVQGETDVSISRAEMDLRKAMQALAFITSGGFSSFTVLTALSLPGAATALLWTINTLLRGDFQRPNLENPIFHRDHDARFLLP